MTEPVKKKFYDYVWVQILVAYLILTPFGSYIYDHSKKISFITPFLKAWNFIWLDIFNYPTPLYLTVIIAVIVGRLVRNRYEFKLSQKAFDELGPKKPNVDYLNWTKDKFKRWTWTWSWWYNSERATYEVSGITPICNKCTFKMGKDNGYEIYKCPNCSNVYSSPNYENYYDIISIIKQRIERGEYPKDHEPVLKKQNNE